MNNRHWLWLLLVGSWLGCAGAAPAQPGDDSRSMGLGLQPARPASHRPLDDAATSFGQAEDLLKERLRQAGELHDLQDKIQELLKSRDFQRELGKLSPAEKRKLLESARKVLNGEKVNIDPGSLDDLLSHPSVQKRLLPNQIDLIKKWAARPDAGPGHLPHVPPFPNDSGPVPPNPPPSGRPGPPPASPRPVPPPPPREGEVPDWNRFQDRYSEWFRGQVAEWARSLDDVDEMPEGHAFREALDQLGRMKPAEGGFNFNLAEKARGWSRYLPLDKLLPGDSSVLRGARTRIGALPGHLSVPDMPDVSDVPVSDAGQGVLLVVVCATLGVVLWMSLAWYRHQGQGGDETWKLGPWPVNPAAVATRGQLVQAFEYLALLRLGRAARTRNHLALAARLGEEAGNDEAAARLARLYEQARYAPPDEQVPEGELAGARRDLCLLAGVGAA